MKKLTALFAGAAIAAATVFGTSAVAETLRMGLLVSNKSLAYRAAEKFAEHVNEATGGEYTVELFPAQQLGSGAEMMQMLKLGTLDFYQGTADSADIFRGRPKFQCIVGPLRLPESG